ncbi:uncharacterized protein LOC124456216 isoform X2 [Xenia sp. Carnegie-2017]|uniref:uncharacterized protein LOC124456216 isoform X2 n=1 Tax=Xenia sp. Carnegie-2017 TaxID=2897299 RepID=UPI001F0424D1|nr:uncharacterized protein LOC124456216 isoform X2 [Xenia sp. Carnegie-2017]
MSSQRKTGGGPATKPPPLTTEKIINILGDETSFSGIQGGFESGGTFVEKESNSFHLSTLVETDEEDEGGEDMELSKTPIPTTSTLSQCEESRTFKRKRPKTQGEMKNDVQQLHVEVLQLEKKKCCLRSTT